MIFLGMPLRYQHLEASERGFLMQRSTPFHSPLEGIAPHSCDKQADRKNPSRTDRAGDVEPPFSQSLSYAGVLVLDLTLSSHR